MISLIGEMVDSQNMTKTTQEITKADTLLLLGTTLLPRCSASTYSILPGGTW